MHIYEKMYVRNCNHNRNRNQHDPMWYKLGTFEYKLISVVPARYQSILRIVQMLSNCYEEVVLHSKTELKCETTTREK